MGGELRPRKLKRERVRGGERGWAIGLGKIRDGSTLLKPGKNLRVTEKFNRMEGREKELRIRTFKLGTHSSILTIPLKKILLAFFLGVKGKRMTVIEYLEIIRTAIQNDKIIVNDIIPRPPFASSVFPPRNTEFDQ